MIGKDFLIDVLNTVSWANQVSRSAVINNDSYPWLLVETPDDTIEFKQNGIRAERYDLFIIIETKASNEMTDDEYGAREKELEEKAKEVNGLLKEKAYETNGISSVDFQRGSISYLTIGNSSCMAMTIPLILNTKF